MAKLIPRSSFKLVTNVSQWGLLTWPAQSRPRLIASTVLVTALTVALAFGSATYILDHSASVFLNLLLITLNMFLMLIGAFLQTILVGDIFFSGNWREEVFLGQKSEEDASQIDVSAVNDHNAEFVVILCLAIVANAVGLNAITDNFFGQYHDEGFFQVQMRADDPDQRLRSLTNLADPINHRLWDRDGLRDLIVDAFDDPDDEVRDMAIWTAGTMEILRSREDLLDVAKTHDDPQTRGEAAFTLGRLGRHSESRVLLESLLHSDEPTDVRIGALRGLAMMEDSRSVEPIMAHIDDPDSEVMAHAFWALARIGDSGPREQIRAIIDEEPHGLRRCAALEAFKGVASAEDAGYARRQFRTTDADERCEAMTFEEPNERTHHVIWGESVRVKWLKIVGNTDPYEHRSWIIRQIRDPEQSDHVRDVAAEINRMMDGE